MTRSFKIVLGVLLAVVVIGGVWYAISRKNSSSTGSSNSTAGSAYNTTPANTNGTASGQMATGTNPATSSESAQSTMATGNSDASLNQNAAAIDAQLNNMNSDSSAANQSLNPQ
jgi:hypothetical protein